MLIFMLFNYLMYNYAIFYYFARIFGTPLVTKFQLLVLSILNTFMFYFPVYISEFQRNDIFMILYFVVLGIEILIVFRQGFINSIAALTCFTINFFGTQLLIIGGLSLYLNQQIVDILQDENLRLQIISFSFLILYPYIYVSSRILISKVVRYLFADIASLKLACVLLATVCLHLFTSAHTLYITTDHVTFNAFYQLRTGSVAMLTFIIIMVIVFIYSRLKQASIAFSNTSAEIEVENLVTKELEEQASTDFFTGFYVRSVALNNLSEYLENNTYCYLSLIDIDRLKIVNDSFGHEEGDKYILMVCDEIKKIFQYDLIARVGGDEFLIVGNQKSPFSIKEKLAKLDRRVTSLQEEYKKEYETSISYGITEVSPLNKQTIDQLIEYTDQKMYEFKVSRNRQR